MKNDSSTPELTDLCHCGHDFGSHNGKRCEQVMGPELRCACLGFKLAPAPRRAAAEAAFEAGRAGELYFILSMERTTGAASCWWWRPDAKGYTSSIGEAGRYTREEALRHPDPPYHLVIPCSAVEVPAGRSKALAKLALRESRFDAARPMHPGLAASIESVTGKVPRMSSANGCKGCGKKNFRKGKRIALLGDDGAVTLALVCLECAARAFRIVRPIGIASSLCRTCEERPARAGAQCALRLARSSWRRS